MFKNFKVIFLLSLMFLEVAVAHTPVSCRVATGAVTKCNPYTSKLIRVVPIKHQKDYRDLIVEKTLPLPEKKAVKKVSIFDLIENHVTVEDSLRYKGTEESELVEEKIKSQPKNEKKGMAEELEEQRHQIIVKMMKMHKEQVKKREEGRRLAAELQAAEEKKRSTEEAGKTTDKKVSETGTYIIESGDSLSTIAAKFKMKTKALRILNNIQEKDHIKIGQKLKIPYPQKRVDTLAKAEYVVEPGDNFISIARDFNVSAKALIKFNDMEKSSPLKIGQKLLLPLLHKLAEAKKTKQLTKKKKGSKFVKRIGKHKLRVTATAYSSHHGQTDKTPFLAAWNNRIRPGMKIIAVSRDMLTKYGLRNGSKVKIGGLPGYYTVRDKMNKRYRKRIDIYMGTDRRRALRWGRRSVILYY